MEDALVTLLQSYLRNQIDMHAVRDWIASNVWGIPIEERGLLDRVAAELAFVDDGYSDEPAFRSQIRNIVVPTLALAIDHREGTSTETSLSHSNSSSEFNFEEIPGKVEDLRFDLVFAGSAAGR